MDDDSFDFGMQYDNNELAASDPYRDDSQEEENTQTQSTQQASQQSSGSSLDAHLWGYLQPCSPALTRIDFWKIHPRYTIGRNTELNQVVLPGFKISNTHCVITWDGLETGTSTVVVQDISSNGTFINGERIGRGHSRIIHEGSEIAFGTSVPQPQNGGLEDYRFVYRHTASGPPTEGLYAHYDIGHELGKGSFATVRRAMSRRTGSWYAIKMIHDQKAVRNSGGGDPANRNSIFSREISIMEKLKHKNICELVEVFFQENNEINLVLELVEGGDLLEYILKHEGLDEQQGKHITYQMCAAIAYIHSKGVTHRDLKPENILLTKDNPPVVKVADFGLAKVVDSMTMLRTMCGTPSYLAPEVVKQVNFEGYDSLVDSWSVGVIVFSMLTNAGPFTGDSEIDGRDMKTRIIERRVDWRTLKEKRVTEHAFDFIRRLLEEDPKRRMSITDSLKHPWLEAHHAAAEAEITPTIEAPAEEIGTINMSSPYKSAPLQRRSQVISEAVESGKQLPEPSWEMIAYANSQEQATGTAAAKNPNKRARADLSPLPEEEGQNDEEMGLAGPSVGSDDSGLRRSARRKVARRS